LALLISSPLITLKDENMIDSQNEETQNLKTEELEFVPEEVQELAAEEKNPDRKWYVIHTLSGHEQKVRNNLLKRIETMNMKDKIFDILVPTEEEVEIKSGKKRIVKRKIFPGYVMVEMIVSDDSWYVVRNTSGVTGFVGSGTKPEPLQDEEAQQLLKQSSGEAPPRRRLSLKIGDKVRITSGPFVEFYGSIQEVNPEKEKIKVLVSIFGRETPVELDYGQVEKL
jgi:transcriptional antiterminator NusG